MLILENLTLFSEQSIEKSLDSRLVGRYADRTFQLEVFSKLPILMFITIQCAPVGLYMIILCIYLYLLAFMYMHMFFSM